MFDSETEELFTWFYEELDGGSDTRQRATTAGGEGNRTPAKPKSESDPYRQGRLNRRRDEHALTAPPLNPQDAVAEQPKSRIGA
jgi:hypothetical protein